MVINGLDTSCYGCGVCSVSCPCKAISIVESVEGFWVPIIDEKLCIDCGICDKVCAYVDRDYCIPKNRLDDIKAYAAFNKNKEIRRDSTSGGIGYAIATYLYTQGYLLVGVKYDIQRNIACHFVTGDLEEFKQTMNSKYIPSYTVDGFSSLMDGRKYAIFGTPCQIDSLRRWARMKKKEQNFVFIDLFCHGVPSYLHWKSYLSYHLKENEALINPIFRDKKNGWHAYTMSLQTNKRYLSIPLQQNDFFQNIFFGNYSLNIPCYQCMYRGNKSAADIRMGDLWGGKYAKNEEGITGVLALTSKGIDIINGISELCDVVEEKSSIVEAGQLHFDLSIPSDREKILKSFKEGKYLPFIYFRYARRMWMKNLIPYTVKTFIKQLIYKIKSR